MCYFLPMFRIEKFNQRAMLLSIFFLFGLAVCPVSSNLDNYHPVNHSLNSVDQFSTIRFTAGPVFKEFHCQNESSEKDFRSHTTVVDQGERFVFTKTIVFDLVKSHFHFDKAILAQAPPIQ